MFVAEVGRKRDGEWSEKGKEISERASENTFCTGVLLVVSFVLMYQVQLNLGGDRPLA